MEKYKNTLNEVINELDTDSVNGLSNEEVLLRRNKFGLNQLDSKKKTSLFVKFLNQFKDAMVIMLIIAAIVSLGVNIYEYVHNNSPATDFIEPIIIFGIVILNAILGVFQESKAEKALDSLKKMFSPKVQVIRNGEHIIIPNEEVVVGDLIVFEAGDVIAADARIIESVLLKCDESSLTGESLPVEKDYKAIYEDEVPVGDRKNMVFSGSYVTYGRGQAVVTDTGMGTEIGRIAKLLNNEKEGMTPLQLKLAKLGKSLGIIALIICSIIFLVGIFVTHKELDMSKRIILTFMMAVSLAVAAIPEGLPTIVTLVLAIGVQRMVKKNAIVRKLPAVETLGSASTICSDKTGTLTQNKMTVTRFYSNGSIIDVNNKLNESSKDLLKNALLCCDARAEEKDGKTVLIGDPTETSIVTLAAENGFEKSEIQLKHPRLGEIPFDSDRKLMTVIYKDGDKNIVVVKGAVDRLIDKCKSGDIESALVANDKMANQALRVLAVAIKEISEVPKELTSELLENDLKFIGLIGMIDPPREEAKDAVKLCIKAGIRPVMITGDHVLTANAIARELGILKDGDKSLTGLELKRMSDDELNDIVKEVSVYARVSPEDKIRIVKAWQNQGAVVAMTGDGVNDAPALKASDIGCAMGITGTEVAKGASDITLMDDNFATIVEAVKEGRSIYNNIRRGVEFLLSCNAGEIVSVFIAILCWQKTPFLAMQLLWINLLTDSFPALALGLEKGHKGIMSEPPRNKKETLFSNGLGYRIIINGIYFGGITLVAYAIGLYCIPGVEPEKAASTLAFIVLSTSQLVHAFNVRTEGTLFKINPFGNMYIILACLLSFVFILLVIYVPFLNNLLGLIQLENKWIAVAMALSVSPFVFVECEKFIKKL